MEKYPQIIVVITSNIPYVMHIFEHSLNGIQEVSGSIPLISTKQTVPHFAVLSVCIWGREIGPLTQNAKRFLSEADQLRSKMRSIRLRSGSIPLISTKLVVQHRGDCDEKVLKSKDFRTFSLCLRFESFCW